jgi:hypothetical protein
MDAYPSNPAVTANRIGEGIEGVSRHTEDVGYAVFRET